MESAVLTSESKSNLAILLNLAKKLGIGVKRLTMEDIEDFGLVNAMKKGRTGKYIDTDKYLAKLRSK
ncbi:hypothetical protein JYU16_00300 [bacterium AH-315-M05]|nr:hypothetical protein [bacterium AH-315-M05]